MKKSKLRKIIRESIKQLMTEQPSLYRRVNVCYCGGQNNITGANLGIQPNGDCVTNSGLVNGISMPIGDGRHIAINDGGTLRPPVAGDYFKYDLQSAALRMSLGVPSGPITFLVRDVNPAPISNSLFNDMPKVNGCTSGGQYIDKHVDREIGIDNTLINKDPDRAPEDFYG